MANHDLKVEDSPDDLTPFITRTTLDHVGGGAFGDVWKCDYNADGISTFVAVKAFRCPEHCDLKKINRKIRREIGILKALRHNNIVPLLGTTTGFGRWPELRCLVTPWIPNGTLNTYLASNPNLIMLARSRMLEDVSAGLRYLHSLHIVHGDITGANILIDEGGHARLIDFGLSTLVRPLLGRSYLAATSIHPGAIRYAAPELFLSDDVCDLPLEKTDLYSFGCVMFQILSGRYPWSEVKSEKPELRIIVLISQGCSPERPNGHPAIMDSDWAIIQNCLQSKPELRPSAAEVYDFVMHRVSPSDSSSPSDDPPDNVQDGFHGASQYDDSDDSDTTERPPNSPPPHPGHELTNVIIEPGSPGPVTVFGTDSRVVQSTGFSGLEQRQSIQPLPPSPPPSPPNVTSSNRESHLPSTVDSSKIRKKIGRFRILIIGRANAGKTTILQRVCNTRDNPEIYNSAREKIDPAVLTPSRERGLHDIENEMVFRHNPGFVFHDSRGFEAGGESEFNMVKAFIADRSKERDIKKRLHVIWYCIPMDEESRSFTQVEHKFFSQCDTGSVPVMVLFTKFDAFYDIEFTQLRRKGTPWKDAEQQAPKLAEVSFANGPYLKFLKDVRWPPKCHICLSNMHFVDADCRPLIERTAETLDNEVLMQMFISTQQINLEFCMKNAVEQTLAELVDSTETISDEGHEKAIGKLGAWFPHLSIYNDYNYDLLDLDLDDLPSNKCAEMASRIRSVTFDSSPLENMVQLSSAVLIIFEHSFYIYDQQRHLPDRRKSVLSFDVALEQYMASPHAAAVKEAVSAAVNAYEEAVGAARNSSTWQAKLPFKRFQRKAKQYFERPWQKEKESLRSQVKAELIETVLQITLKHRLSMQYNIHDVPVWSGAEVSRR